MIISPVVQSMPFKIRLEWITARRFSLVTARTVGHMTLLVVRQESCYIRDSARRGVQSHTIMDDVGAGARP